jgi:YD repeat-containing protein
MILKKKAYQTHELLLGAWRLVSWEARDATGRITYPLGEDARGQLSYDGSGRMSAQLMRQHQAVLPARIGNRPARKRKQPLGATTLAISEPIRLMKMPEL